MRVKKTQGTATRSSRETEQLGAEMARAVLVRGPQKAAVVVALRGDLGAGKTTFVRGFFRGLGLRARVMSPTFILLRRTAIRRGPQAPSISKGFQNVFHADAYRATAKDFAALGLREIMRDPSNIVLIEWPERVARLLPKTAHRLQFLHGRQEHERTVRREAQ